MEDTAEWTLSLLYMLEVRNINYMCFISTFTLWNMMKKTFNHQEFFDSTKARKDWKTDWTFEGLVIIIQIMIHQPIEAEFYSSAV